MKYMICKCMFFMKNWFKRYQKLKKNMVIGNFFEVNDNYAYNSFLKSIGFNIVKLL